MIAKNEKREHWKSKLGFMWAAIGSAVGLGSIWRFPYIVGENGGAVFVLLFCVFLIFLSLPIMLSEIVIGRKTQSNPSDAFKKLGKSNFWKALGTLQVITGFLVSIFYSVICAWTLGFFIEQLSGNVSNFASLEEAKAFWESCLASPSWVLGSEIGFIFLAAAVLFVGVQKGIEATNKILMPLLFILLFILAIVGLQMQGAGKGLSFLFTPDWSLLNGKVALLALGQACFGLSVGQGTIITYGSYLKKSDNIFKISLPVTVSVVVVSLLAGVAIFTVLFSFSDVASDGPELMFAVLPMVFSKMYFGGLLSLLFSLLIIFAGLTSQISAMEPFIAYLIDHKAFSRHGAVAFCSIGVLFFGMITALSFGPLSYITIFGENLFNALAFLCVNVLIPLGALFVLILVGWKNPFENFVSHLELGSNVKIENTRWLFSSLRFVIRYLVPVAIFLIFLNLIYAM